MALDINGYNDAFKAFTDFTPQPTGRPPRGRHVPLETRRAEAIEELSAAFAELESGEGLTRLVGGHGIQSRVFEFEWSEPALDISFRIPYGRVLSDEETQKEDDANLGAAIRMAILLLTAAAGGKLLFEGESALSVAADEDGARYSIGGPDGAEIDAAENWAPLVARLEAALSDGDDVQIIWP